MPYPRPHHLLVIYGTLVNGAVQEEWQTGVRIGVASGTEAFLEGDVSPAALDDIAADLSTWWAAITHVYPSSTVLRGFKFNHIGTDGLYTNTSETFGRAFGSGGKPGTGGGSPMPAQLAIAATLLTEKGRGLANKGRMFLPVCSNGGLNGDATLFGAYRDDLQNATAQLLTNLGNWPGVDEPSGLGYPVVASKVRTGDMERISAVSIGNRFDVQRSRAGKIPERRGNPSPVT